ncbi:LacI family DNA-binding transcriptional regulator [Cephaloticoccus primus]|nr:LacI family DNA-binding transcriptional regulator [Cephaloticoccus primus]
MKKPQPASPEAPARVTLKDIAQAARVSVMTVSYALRGSPQISQPQRERIRKLAAELGYHPDPLLTHLMTHLRGGRGSPKTSENLALLTMYEPPFVSRLIHGARARAAQLGYTLDRINLSQIPSKAVLTRTLLARGVAGIILTPAKCPDTYRELLDWTLFATTAVGYSFTELPVNRVVTHHFDNAHRVFALLRERGFSRIGLAMTPDMEFRANHSYSGAYCRLDAIDSVKTVPILMIEEQTRQQSVPRWLARHRPDAVVLANSNHFRESILPHTPISTLRKTAFACLDQQPTDGIAGIDQLFETIGTKAVDDVVNQILRNERGLPTNPIVTMLEGKWCEAAGLYPRL